MRPLSHEYTGNTTIINHISGGIWSGEFEHADIGLTGERDFGSGRELRTHVRQAEKSTLASGKAYSVLPSRSIAANFSAGIGGEKR